MKKWLFLIILFLLISFLVTVYSFWALGYFFAPEQYSFIYRVLYTMGYFLSSKLMLKSYAYIVLFLLIAPITISLSISIYEKCRTRNERLIDEEIIDLQNQLTETIKKKENEIEKYKIKKIEIDRYINHEVNRLYNEKGLDFAVEEYNLEQKKEMILEKEKIIEEKTCNINCYLEEIKNLKNKITVKNTKIAEIKGTIKKVIQLILENNPGFAIRILKKMK
ncbi:MAG: hypothetical protein WC124_00085 [Desulfoplanes sp.]